MSHCVYIVTWPEQIVKALAMLQALPRASPEQCAAPP
jgi:hypothetical protein